MKITVDDDEEISNIIKGRVEVRLKSQAGAHLYTRLGSMTNPYDDIEIGFKIFDKIFYSSFGLTSDYELTRHVSFFKKIVNLDE